MSHLVNKAVGGIEGAFGAKNNYQATAPVNAYNAKPADLATTNYGGTIQAGADQAAQAGVQQNALADMLTSQANGGGPNPALEQLNPTTSANINNAAGQVAGTRGLNPALAARLALDAGAGANQQAAGQAATMRAEQTLNAQGLLSQVLAQKQNAGLSQFGTAGQLQQGQNAVDVQNTLGTNQINAGVASQNAALNLGAQQINAGVSAQNAQTGAGLLGGALNGIGGAIGKGGGGASQGGEVPAFDDGGSVPDLHSYLDSLSTPKPQPSLGTPTLTAAPRFQPIPTAMLSDPIANPMPTATGTMLDQNLAAQQPGGSRVAGSVASGMGAGLGGNAGLAAFDRFAGRHVSGSALANGGSIFAADGYVPGSPEVQGDSPKNDKVDAKLSPGEFVVKRTAMAQPGVKEFVREINDHPEHASAFVAHLARRRGSAGYDRVLQARGVNLADGGDVQQPPTLWQSVKHWATSSGDEQTEAGREVLESVHKSLPDFLSGHKAVEQQRTRQDEAYETSKDEKNQGGPVTARGRGRGEHRSRIKRADGPKAEE